MSTWASIYVEHRPLVQVTLILIAVSAKMSFELLHIYYVTNTIPSSAATGTERNSNNETSESPKYRQNTRGKPTPSASVI